MIEAIKNFPKQFAYQPEIKNADQLQRRKIFIVLGMGGSHLAADLIVAYKPTEDIMVHSDYGLDFPESVLADALIIASSYSGNTEETLSAYEAAKRDGLSLAVIAVGGELLRRAQADAIPSITLPDTGIQPRMALGFSARAMLTLMGEKSVLTTMSQLSQTLHPDACEEAGRSLAADMRGHIPIFYSSRANQAIALNAKIKSNETGKIPAFWNVVPELNHNEMTGFDVPASSRSIMSIFHAVLFHDDADHPRVQKRLQIVEQLYRDRQLPITTIDISDPDPWHKIFSALLLEDWFALATAEANAAESEQVPMVEEFKRKMKE